LSGGLGHPREVRHPSPSGRRTASALRCVVPAIRAVRRRGARSVWPSPSVPSSLRRRPASPPTVAGVNELAGTGQAMGSRRSGASV